MIRPDEPLVSFNKALLNPCFWGVRLAGSGLTCHCETVAIGDGTSYTSAACTEYCLHLPEI